MLILSKYPTSLVLRSFSKIRKNCQSRNRPIIVDIVSSPTLVYGVMDFFNDLGNTPVLKQRLARWDIIGDISLLINLIYLLEIVSQPGASSVLRPLMIWCITSWGSVSSSTYKWLHCSMIVVTYLLMAIICNFAILSNLRQYYNKIDVSKRNRFQRNSSRRNQQKLIAFHSNTIRSYFACVNLGVHEVPITGQGCQRNLLHLREFMHVKCISITIIVYHWEQYLFELR